MSAVEWRRQRRPGIWRRPLDGFGKLTAGRPGALTHSTQLRVILSLSKDELSNGQRAALQFRTVVG